MNLSIVIPVYNEVDSLPLLHQALTQALTPTPYSWEVVLVDDGSSDGSLACLEQLAAADTAHVRVVGLRRNFGQSTAIAAGIDHACGEVIVLMDSDLQNDPIDIPLLMEKIAEGYDVVSGWRKQRQDQLLTRKIPSQLANGLISRVTGVRLHDYGCTLKAYRREVITGFRLYGEMHRFIPVYANRVGARLLEVPVNHHARKFGKTKYGLKRTFKVILDLCAVSLLTRYIDKPVYLFGGIGMGVVAAGLLALFGLAAPPTWLAQHQGIVHILATSLLLITLGIVCVLLGLLAEVLSRAFFESRGATVYTLRKTINIETVTRSTPAVPRG